MPSPTPPWMPTWPTLRPLSRSKVERLDGKEPSVFARLWHVLKQLVPNPNFILKWCAAGAFALAAFTAFFVIMTPTLLRWDNKAAKVDRDDRIKKHELAVKETARKEAIIAVKLADEDQDRRIEEHARGNWETWKSQFTSDTDGIACAYGRITVPPEDKKFNITCQIGPKGHLPTQVILCDQNSCKAPKPINEPEPKK